VSVHLSEFQALIERIYHRIYPRRDADRGLAGTHMWFAEEVGELTRALRRGRADELEGEFADVLAWLATLASLSGVDLERAAREKYQHGGPRCGATPCACP
jgi:NTP pyrophosphatase (non-canonical NTP hydrolase)